MKSLGEYLENCKIPLSRDDWAGFFKGLDALNLTYRNLYGDWIKHKRNRFEWVSKAVLDDNRIKDSLILVLHQNEQLRWRLGYLERSLKEECEAGGYAGLRERMRQSELQEAKKKRDLKPTAPGVTQNWLEPMPIFNEGEPRGYVQATGQSRKVIKNFLRQIKAKPEGRLTKKQRGRPVQLYGFETNCRVLDQRLGRWCAQNGEQKYDVVLDEALILANAVAKSKKPVIKTRLARLRKILTTHARPVAKEIGYDSKFDFLRSPAACICQIRLLDEQRAKNRPA